VALKKTKEKKPEQRRARENEVRHVQQFNLLLSLPWPCDWNPTMWDIQTDQSDHFNFPHLTKGVTIKRHNVHMS